MATLTLDQKSYGISRQVTTLGAEGIRLVSGQFAFDSAYPTGGESMDLSSYFTRVDGVMFESKAGYQFAYDYTNKKVLAYTLAHTHTENTAATYTQNATTASATPGTEVANGTDLSAVTVRFVAWGI